MVKRIFYILSFYFCGSFSLFNKYNNPRMSFFSFVDNKTEIGNYSKIYRFCKIRNTKIGSYTYVSPNCSMNNTFIGSFCSIATGVKSGYGKHPINFVSTSPLFYSLKNALGTSFSSDNHFEEYEPVKIGNDVWIGADAMILDGVTIGDGAIVAAKSLVNKDVEPYAIVGGIPAKLIKKRFSDDQIKSLRKIKWWEWPTDKLMNNARYFDDVDLLIKENLPR